MRAHDISLGFDCRFVFNEGPARDVLYRYLVQDMQHARLSPAYRAYYRVRCMVPLRLRQWLQSRHTTTGSYESFVPAPFLKSLTAAVRSVDGVTVIHPWPDGKQFAFVPTHDVETSDGFRRIPRIADLEERLGVRSVWNIVPYKYPVDLGLVRDLQTRGFEIGVHGFNHDGRLFLSQRVFKGRTAGINAAMQRFGAAGFRAPMVHRNLVWQQKIEAEYDASCFDIDPFQAMPGGIGGVWPLICGRFVELPYTLPQDHTLFVVLQKKNGELWQRKLSYVAKLGGMAMLITHPDYLHEGYPLDAYHQLLETALSMNGVWLARPIDIVNWWRERDQSALVDGLNGELEIDGPAKHRGRIAVFRDDRHQDPTSPSLTWSNLAQPATTCSSARPHVGTR